MTFMYMKRDCEREVNVHAFIYRSFAQLMRGENIDKRKLLTDLQDAIRVNLIGTF
jgi:hypothetical protein